MPVLAARRATTTWCGTRGSLRRSGTTSSRIQCERSVAASVLVRDMEVGVQARPQASGASTSWRLEANGGLTPPTGAPNAPSTHHTACAVGYDLPPFGLRTRRQGTPMAYAMGYDLEQNPVRAVRRGFCVGARHGSWRAGETAGIWSFHILASGGERWSYAPYRGSECPSTHHTACAVGYDLPPFGLRTRRQGTPWLTPWA